ncbi:hypothetical protein KCP74_10575 [Salmonella enterica subsp. enterica]|nr:hypothetical protein KCP74_10575 [Salmonella enterica subsp. enterica]
MRLSLRYYYCAAGTAQRDLRRSPRAISSLNGNENSITVTLKMATPLCPTRTGVAEDDVVKIPAISPPCRHCSVLSQKTDGQVKVQPPPAAAVSHVTGKSVYFNVRKFRRKVEISLIRLRRAKTRIKFSTARCRRPAGGDAPVADEAHDPPVYDGVIRQPHTVLPHHQQCRSKEN